MPETKTAPTMRSVRMHASLRDRLVAKYQEQKDALEITCRNDYFATLLAESLRKPANRAKIRARLDANKEMIVPQPRSQAHLQLRFFDQQVMDETFAAMQELIEEFAAWGKYFQYHVTNIVADQFLKGEVTVTAATFQRGV